MDSLGCEYSAKDGFLKVKRGVMIATSEKVKNLYKLIGKTAVNGVVKVEPNQEESSFIVKEVVIVKTYSKMLVIIEDKAWKKKKLGSHFKFDESLNLTHLFLLSMSVS